MLFDLFFIIIICVFAIIGYKKGMMQSLFSILNITIAVYISYSLSPIVFNNICQMLNIENFDSNSTLTNFGIFVMTRNILNANNIQTISLYVIISLVCYFAIYWIVKIITKHFLQKLLVLVKNNIEYSNYDNFYGVVFGTVKGIIYSFLIGMIIIALNNVGMLNNIITTEIGNSSLLNMFASICNV